MNQKSRGSRTTANQTANSTVVTQESVEISSPYPPIEFISGYNQIESTAADRILRIVEENQKANIEFARSQLAEASKINDANIVARKEDLRIAKNGAHHAIFVCILLSCVACYALFLGYPYVAVAAFSPMVLMTGMYVLRKMPNSSKDN